MDDNGTCPYSLESNYMQMISLKTSKTIYPTVLHI